MLQRVARSFAVDTATSKATCVDLMRANAFDVLVASERLSDGSGLELLSHVATRWPDTLRVLVIEPQRLKLLGSKLTPFRLHATLSYPIDEDELEAVLNRMYELLDEEPEPAPPAAPAKVEKAPVPQPPARPSSQAARMPAQAPKQTSRSARASQPLGSPLEQERPPVRRKLGNYTPLGTADDEQLRIVEREFDQTVAPLAARAIRTREEANRPRSVREKFGTLASQLGEKLRRLLKR